MVPDFEKIGLLIVDVQEKLLPAIPAEIVAQMLRNIDILAEVVSDCGGTIVYTEQYPKGLGSTIATLKPRLSKAVRVEKISFSCLEEPRFVEEILPTLPDDLIVVGMETHVCVLQTIIDLSMEESGEERVIYVPIDAVASRTKANWRNALDQMNVLDNVLQTNTESLLFQFLHDARHDRFKHYSQRIR